jgi:hypothetical protein
MLAFGKLNVPPTGLLEVVCDDFDLLGQHLLKRWLRVFFLFYDLGLLDSLRQEKRIRNAGERLDGLADGRLVW